MHYLPRSVCSWTKHNYCNLLYTQRYITSGSHTSVIGLADERIFLPRAFSTNANPKVYRPKDAKIPANTRHLNKVGGSRVNYTNARIVSPSILNENQTYTTGKYDSVERQLNFILTNGTTGSSLKSILNVVGYAQRNDMPSEKNKKLRQILEADSASLILKSLVHRVPGMFFALVNFKVRISELGLFRFLHQNLMKGGTDYLYELVKGSTSPVGGKSIDTLKQPLTATEREFLIHSYPGVVVVFVAIQFIYLGDYQKAREYLDILRVSADRNKGLQKVHVFLNWFLTLLMNNSSVFNIQTAKDPEVMLRALGKIPNIHEIPSIYFNDLSPFLFSKVIFDLNSLKASPRMIYFAACFFCPKIIQQDSLMLKEAFSITKEEEQLVTSTKGLLRLDERLLAPVYDAIFRDTSKKFSLEAILELFKGLMATFSNAPICCYSFLSKALIMVNNSPDEFQSNLATYLSGIKYPYSRRLAYLFTIAFDYYSSHEVGYTHFLQTMHHYSNAWEKITLNNSLISSILSKVPHSEKTNVFMDLTNAGVRFNDDEYNLFQDSLKQFLSKNAHNQDAFLEQLLGSQIDSEALLNFDNTKRAVTQFSSSFCNEIANSIYVPRNCERKVEEYREIAHFCNDAYIDHFNEIDLNLSFASSTETPSNLLIPASVCESVMEKTGKLNIANLEEILRTRVLTSDILPMSKTTVLRMHTINVRHFHDEGYPAEYVLEYMALFFKSFEKTAKVLGLCEIMKIDLTSYSNYPIVPGFLSFYRVLPGNMELVNLCGMILNEPNRSFKDFKILFENGIIKHGFKSLGLNEHEQLSISRIIFETAIRFDRLDGSLFQITKRLRREFPSKRVRDYIDYEVEEPIRLLHAGVSSKKQPFDHFWKYLNKLKPFSTPLKPSVTSIKRILKITPVVKIVDVFLKMADKGYQIDYYPRFRSMILKLLLEGNLDTKYCILRGHYPNEKLSGDLKKAFFSDLNDEERIFITTRYSKALLIKLVEYWMTQDNEKKTYEYLKLCSLKKNTSVKDRYFLNQLRLRADLLFEKFIPFGEGQADNNNSDDDFNDQSDISNEEAVQRLRKICAQYEKTLHSYELNHYPEYLLFKTHRFNLSRYRVFSNFKIIMGYLLLYCPLSLDVFTEIGLFRTFHLNPQDLTRDVKIDRKLVCPSTHLLMLTQIFRNIFIILGNKISEDQAIMLFDGILACDKKHEFIILNPKNSSRILNAFITFASIQGYTKLLFFIYRCMIENKLYYDNMGSFMSVFLEQLINKSPKLCAEKVDEFRRKFPDDKIHYKTYAIMIKRLAVDDSHAAYRVYLHFIRDHPGYSSSTDSHDLMPIIKRLGWKRDKYFAKQFGNTDGKPELRVKVDHFNVRLYDYDKLGD